MTRRLLPALLALVALAAGCGTHHAATGHVRPAPTLAAKRAAACAYPGQGHMGVCLGTPRQLPRHPATVSGRLCVDVSSYQGRPNWAAARGHISCAVVKAGEEGYGRDSSFSYNWHELARLRIPHTAYWFARLGSSCTAQADKLIAIVNSAGGWRDGDLPPVEDAEVPGVGASFSRCFAVRVSTRTHFPRPGVVYTSPGTWGGGNPVAPLWVATYGPGFGCVWTCSPVAWQFTGDGIGPLPHCVTGIGCQLDVDQDRGLIAMARHTCPAGPSSVGAPWKRRPCQRATIAEAVRFVQGHPYWDRTHPRWLRGHPYVANRCARPFCRAP